MPVVGVRSLAEAVEVVRDRGFRAKALERGRRWLQMKRSIFEEQRDRGPDLAEVTGHHHAKRALEIAAAGGHHLLMVGSPGAGKTMLARRLPGILPPLARNEALDVTRIWNASGLHEPRAELVTQRPFRSPHHTASRAALVGGGVHLRPGEVSLAHHGVLFLDEFPEFSRDALEALRQPLEEGRISIDRRAGTCTFPAACTLVAAMNPCPCGYLGHEHTACRCTAASIERYRSRVSGPLLDRIDALIEVPPFTLRQLDLGGREEPSAAVRERVVSARIFREARCRAAMERASERLGSGRVGGVAGMVQSIPAYLETQNHLTREACLLLRQALVKESLSGRAYVRVINLARTIADLDNLMTVGQDHVAEALSFRLDYRRVGFS